MKLKSVLLFSVAVQALACGRTVYLDDRDSGADADEIIVEKQPDLRLLLPERVASLVGYWRMEGDWADSGLNINTLEVATGAPTITDATAAVGAQSTQLYDASLWVTNRPSIEAEALSFSVWFISDLVATATSNSSQCLIKYSCPTCGGDAEIESAFSVAVQNNGRFVMGTKGTEAIRVDTGVTADAWHHLAGSYGPGGTRLILDGTVIHSSDEARPSLQTSGSYLILGRLWPNISPLFNPQYLHGNLDDVAIWNVQLTDEELGSLYDNQLP